MLFWIIHSCPENWNFQRSFITNKTTYISIYPFICCVSSYFSDSYFSQFKLISCQFPLALFSSTTLNYLHLYNPTGIFTHFPLSLKYFFSFFFWIHFLKKQTKTTNIFFQLSKTRLLSLLCALSTSFTFTVANVLYIVIVN